MTAPESEFHSPPLARLAESSRAAVRKLFPLVYRELRDLAAGHLTRERRDHTLQPTALVHEAYLRLIDQNRVEWHGPKHFLAVASRMMRRVLSDHARRHRAAKRGGEWQRVALPDCLAETPGQEADLLDLDDALTRLEALDERQARVVELRFFGGLGIEETAQVLGVSKTTIETEWRIARMWLSRELSAGPRQ